MREREGEIKKLRKTLEEKEEVVQVLESQVELLRKQVIIMKASRPNNNGNGAGSSTKSSVKDMNDANIDLVIEPQVNGVCRASKSPSPVRGNIKKTCCTIL